MGAIYIGIIRYNIAGNNSMVNDIEAENNFIPRVRIVLKFFLQVPILNGRLNANIEAGGCNVYIIVVIAVN